MFIYLHGALSHQEQGMTARIYNGAFERWGEELARRSAVYICPEYRGNSWMGPAAEADLQDIIRMVNQRYPGRCRILVCQLWAKGARCHYTELPEGDHDAPLQVPLSELLDFVIPTKAPEQG